MCHVPRGVSPIATAHDRDQTRQRGLHGGTLAPWANTASDVQEAEKCPGIPTGGPGILGIVPDKLIIYGPVGTHHKEISPGIPPVCTTLDTASGNIAPRPLTALLWRYAQGNDWECHRTPNAIYCARARNGSLSTVVVAPITLCPSTLCMAH